jgi:hypothetical protein
MGVELVGGRSKSLECKASLQEQERCSERLGGHIGRQILDKIGDETVKSRRARGQSKMLRSASITEAEEVLR